MKEFEKDYYVTNDGNVFSGRGKSLRKLKPFYHNKGYLKIKTSHDNKTKTHYVHRLVGKYFVKGYKPELQINHIDGNKENNHYTNLEWTTCLENMRHSYKIGLRDFQLLFHRGESIGTSKLKDVQVREIKYILRNKSFDRKSIAETFNVSQTTITDIKNGKTWSHI